MMGVEGGKGLDTSRNKYNLMGDIDGENAGEEQ
jgi:hypothetical protein